MAYATSQILGIAGLALVVSAGLSVSPARAGDDAAGLATELANPLAKLISIPFQGNYNGGIGPLEDGDQVYVNLQPVVPFTLNEDWNLISRTILPVTWQDDIFPTAGTQFGLGNTTQSFFFSPANTVAGITWGIGPVLYLPTNTNDLLGPDTWGAGPTAVALWQGKGWTVGVLANQIWSFAGDNSDDVNATYVQPFLSYTTPSAWTFTLNTESTYNWLEHEWSVPINAQVAKLVKIDGKLPVSFFGGIRYWADSPDDVGPTGWGARFGFTVLLPKG
jgi:hypothetical protein